MIFWNGHVAIMIDAEKLIHANAHTMSVEIEPLELVVIIASVDGKLLTGITSVRRISALTFNYESITDLKH